MPPSGVPASQDPPEIVIIIFVIVGLGVGAGLPGLQRLAGSGPSPAWKLLLRVLAH